MEKETSTLLRDVLHVVFKRKTHVLLFFAVTVCIVAVASIMTEHTYVATAQLFVKVGKEDVYVPNVPTAGSSVIVNRERSSQINSEIEILKSRTLAEKVVDSLGPAVIYEELDSPSQGLLSRLFQLFFETPEPEPLSREAQVAIAASIVQGNLEIWPVEASNVISVSFTHTDARMAAKVLNTLVSEYLDRHLEVHKSPESHEFFREQAELLRNKKGQSEARLELFKKQHDLTSLDEERSLLLRQEADLRTALNQTLSQEAETENRLRNPVPDGQLLSRLVDLELKEQEVLTKYTDESRLVQSVREEIRMVRRAMAEQERIRYGAEMKALRAREETQRSHLAAIQKKLEKLNQIEMESNRLHQEVEVNRGNYQLYLTKFEETRISDAMDTERITNVRLIEPAQPPLAPERRKVFRNLVLAVLLGGVGGLGLAFFSESLDGSLERIEDVENHLSLPVLASIPHLER